LNVFPVEVPPLRARAGDIPLLVNYFLGRFAKKLGKRFDGVSQATMDRLTSYAWPGNIRELENVIERAAILAQGPMIQIDESLLGLHAANQMTGVGTLEDVERAHIVHVLQDVGWAVEGTHGAAVRLGLHPNTLRSRMQKLGIKKPRPTSS
jgi:transcriptional regulator with GAF, ATPase, and Fis domain